MKNIFIALILLYAVSALSSCTKGGKLDSVNGDTYIITGNSNGAQIVPADTLAATGTFTGWYDEQLNVLTFTLSWTNIWSGKVQDAITAIKFYAPAAAGVNGSLIHTIKFNNASASGTINLAIGGSNELLDAERNAMYAGNCYYIICTNNYPNGAIRGQLNAVKRDPNAVANNPVTNIDFLITNKTQLQIGDTTTLKVNIQPFYATNKSLKWTSSDNTIVSISQTGKITGLSKGLATVTAAALDGSGVKNTILIIVNMTVQDLSRVGWTVTASDEKASDGGGKDAILDGNLTTYWHSMWGPDVPLPHWLLVDMKQIQDVAQVRIIRRAANTDTKTVVVETSLDGVIFTLAGSIITYDATGTGSISFAPVKAQYIRLTYPDSNRPPYTNTAEMYVAAYQ
jgi:hypothetical protein